jgi:hypothetical protein
LELKIKKLKITMQKSDNHYDADMIMIRIQALEWVQSKLVALRISETLGDNGKPMTPDHNMISYKLKTSPGKRTYLGPKQIQRTIKNEKIVEDIIILEHEKEVSSYLGAPLLRRIVDNGCHVYEMP